GVNLSKIRSSKELLSSGGTASGPVSFMRGADASAGTIKSGGATRRAAKMVVLDVDHPDVEEFIETKAREEDKIRVLRDAGFDMDLGGKDIASVQYQNANNSVRVSDEFMRAVETGGRFDLNARRTGEVVRTVATTPTRYLITGRNEVTELRFSDGSKLRCTANHRVWTANRGWVAAADLTPEDRVVRSFHPAARSTTDPAIPSRALAAARAA